jgi:hypothetical protein
MKLTLDRTKNHEFRKYMMSNKVQRVWWVRFFAPIDHHLTCGNKGSTSLRLVCAVVSGSQQRTDLLMQLKPPVDQTLRYIAVISHAKAPGEIEREDGVGNAEFNAGLMQEVATHAYKIKELYQLRHPIPLQVMQRTYGVTFPQRYSYIPETMMANFLLKDQIQLF